MTASGVDNSVSLRPVGPEDRTFLRMVYAGTRADELAMTPWNEEEKQAFIEMQFEAQHKYYQENYVTADFLVVEREGRPIGRLYVERRPDEIRLIDIALLPSERGNGVGGALMEEILVEARERGLPVRIHVEKNNRALRLYERLGFRVIADRGVYHLMEWKNGD